MKNFYNLSILFVCVALILVSCSKDEDGEEPTKGPDTSANSMKASIDGAAWEATLAVVASSDPVVVTCTGSDSNSQQLMFSINNPTGAGDYTLGGSLTNPNMGRWTKGLGQNDTYTTMLGQGTGTVSIAEMSDTGFSGTFSFTAKNGLGEEVFITSGEFNATFQ